MVTSIQDVTAEATTIVGWAASIHAALLARGLDPQPLFEQAGVDTALLNDANARFSVTAMSKLWRIVIAATADPAFPLSIPEHTQPGTIHGLGFAVLTSATLRDALLRVQRYSAIISTAARVELREEGELFVVELIPLAKAEDAAFEAFIANIWFTGKSLGLASQVVIGQVQFRSPQPTDSSPFTRYFGTEVDFAADRWAISFPVEYLDKALPSANADLANANDRVVKEYLNRFDQDIRQRARQAIIDLLSGGFPTAEEVAARLNISLRSLQRQLADASLSFTGLRESVQRELAEQWLNEADPSLLEITFRLGFTDQSNFSKAFKRWSGVTPSQYRNGQRPST